MNKRSTGQYITISTIDEVCKAFVPDSLPPNPSLDIDDELRESIDQALLALGRLDTITTLLPDAALFLYAYIRKEAVLSSQIEGTQSSLSDLLIHESEQAPGLPMSDVVEVSHYVAAMEHGLERLRLGFPLSLRLIREIHEVLLSHNRGRDKMPGEFRRSQNWIGGTRPGNARFVPPPSELIMDCMGNLEKFLHNDPVKTSPLIKAALAHVQFETIHPFIDGNGRLGRLLITLLLCSEGVLHDPLLYISLFLKSHRDEYYEHLQNVRIEGDWEAWLKFFITGVRSTAEQAVDTTKRLMNLIVNNSREIQSLGKGGRSVMHVFNILSKKPIIRIAKLAKETGLTQPTVSLSLSKLEKLGIVHEVTGKPRNRIYAYSEYIKILSEGTEPIV